MRSLSKPQPVPLRQSFSASSTVHSRAPGTCAQMASASSYVPAGQLTLSHWGLSVHGQVKPEVRAVLGDRTSHRPENSVGGSFEQQRISCTSSLGAR